MSKEEKNADKKFKQAKQAITISVFNWSKDYASAASTFEQALKMYKAIPNYTKCISTLQQLVKCNQKMVDHWAVARNYEEMLDIYIAQLPKTPVQQLKNICNLCFINFRMSESVDKGLVAVGKLAKFLIDRGQMKDGVQYLQQAYKTIVSEDKIFKKQDIFNQIIDIYMQNNILPGAQKFYLDQIKLRQGKDCSQLGLILLLLIIIQREPKRAQKKMYELSDIIPSFLTSDQCQAADQLLKAYNQGDEAKFRKLTTKAVITCLYPLSIIRKLRQVKFENLQSFQNKNEADSKNSKQNALKQILF